MIETFYLVILATVFLLVLLYSPRPSCGKSILAEQYGESATQLFIKLNTVVGLVKNLIDSRRVYADQLHLWRYALY